MRFKGTCLIAVLLPGSATGLVSAQVAQLQPEALAQIAVLRQEKVSRTPTQLKIDSNMLLALKQERGDPLFEALPKLQPRVDLSEDGTVLVDIKARVTEGLLREIEARGGTVVNSHPDYQAGGHLRQGDGACPDAHLHGRLRVR